MSLIKTLFFVSGPGKKKILGIGAPSSPFVSNLVMYELDEKFTTFANKSTGRYTRYADDLTFSSNDKANCLRFYDYVKQTLAETDSPNLLVNEEKNYLSSRFSRRVVTGLVICPSGEVKLGRKKKRYIRSLINSYCFKNLDEKKINHLKGHLAFLYDVEPTYINNLMTKYGSTIIRKIIEN